MIKVTITKLILVFATIVATVSCVPKATDKKAVCGENQAFDSVSRSCYSITEIRYKPEATKTSEGLAQETAETLTLTYTDKNKDQATSCSVTGISSNIEVISPLVVNGGLFTKALEVADSASDLADAIPAGADKASATAAQSALLAAVDSAQKTYLYSKIISQMGIFKTQVALLTTLATNYPSDTSVQYFNTLTQSRLAVLNPMLSMVDGRCECTAGVCTTTVIPKINQTGAGGFTYTVTDADGTSNPRAVTTTITAMATTTSHLKPVAESSYEIFSESATATASSHSFSLPSGDDLFGTTSFKYTFAGSKNGSNQGLTTAGKVWGCMDLTGSSGATDNTCLYSPTNGDAFTPVAAPVTAASLTIGPLTFEALSPGQFGNNITVQYYNLQNSMISADPYLTKTQLYGMVSASTNESFVRVVGNAIKVFINPGITTSDDIRDMLNDHPQASRLVSVTDNGTVTFPTATTATALSGGVDAFDTVPFTISNSTATSANTSHVMIRMNPTDDVPVMNYVASTSTTVLEDVTPININLSSTFTDVDTDDVTYFNTCEIDQTDAVFLSYFTLPVVSCSCVLTTCTAQIIPNANISSATAFTFAYRIGSYNGLTTQYTSYRSYSVNITPVNDEPTLAGVSNQTIAESTSTVPNSGYIDVTVGAGGSGFESSQTLTLTATSGNTTLLPDANLVITTPSAGVRRITYTPVLNKSGSALVTVNLKDNGGTANGGDDEVTQTFTLTVTPVNDPPYFISGPTTINTNEGGAVQTDAFHIDEDMGSSDDEDVQGIVISNVVSDNTTVLPASAITMFYDYDGDGIEDLGEEKDIGDTLEAASANDVSDYKLYLKFAPINGVDGSANVTITITDGTTPTTKSVSLIVHPVASLHGGWENLTAVGLKTDKLGNPVSQTDTVCNYNKTTDTHQCGTSDCTGTSAPHGVITPDAANTIFYDSSNKKCYRSTGTTAFTWVDLKTSCPITRQTGICSDNNCISSARPTPTASGQYHYDTDDGVCSVSTGTGAGDWETFVPSKITINWKNFTISGTGSSSGVQIAGWNVYRRESDSTYNFKGGHLRTTGSTATMTITDPSVRTFTDNTAVAGKVYYYLVRPVDNLRNLPTYTPEIYSEVRMLAPTTNYTFVHRWMINQEICTSMNMSTTTDNAIDQTNNFSCPYIGPGHNGGRYDYGSDLLVDLQEMGCPYTAAPKCSADGCIGIGSPSVTAGIATGDVYYDRNNGACHIYNGAAWVEMQSAGAGLFTAAVSNALKTALNAPLVRVTQTQAGVICGARPTPSMSGLDEVLTAKLPSKKDYIAYSAHPLNMNDSDISNLEQGFSLNIQSRCNASDASGLEVAFTDSNIPSTSFMYTLPGTAASGIRTLYTGSIPLGASKSTEACVSRYGIQDLFGNVAEWTTDTLTCTAGNCAAPGTSSFAYDWDTTGATRHYGFDLIVGPYHDGGDGIINNGGDFFIADWTFADEFYEAGKFSLPIGMPISNNITTNVDTKDSPALEWVLDIGPSSGITNARLHDDGFILNGEEGLSGAIAVGGSYVSGSRAGRWSGELVPSIGFGNDLGFRCILPISETGYIPDSYHAYPY